MPLISCWSLTWLYSWANEAQKTRRSWICVVRVLVQIHHWTVISLDESCLDPFRSAIAAVQKMDKLVNESIGEKNAVCSMEWRCRYGCKETGQDR